MITLSPLYGRLYYVCVHICIYIFSYSYSIFKQELLKYFRISLTFLWYGLEEVEKNEIHSQGLSQVLT